MTGIAGGGFPPGMGPSLRAVFEFLKKELNSVPDPTLSEQMQLALLIRVVWDQREEYKSISERFMSAALRNQHAMLWDMEPGTRDRFENFLREQRQAEWHRRKDREDERVREEAKYIFSPIVPPFPFPYDRIDRGEVPDIRKDHKELQEIYDELDSILATMRHRLRFG